MRKLDRRARSRIGEHELWSMRRVSDIRGEQEEL